MKRILLLTLLFMTLVLQFVKAQCVYIPTEGTLPFCDGTTINMQLTDCTGSNFVWSVDNATIASITSTDGNQAVLQMVAGASGTFNVSCQVDGGTTYTQEFSSNNTAAASFSDETGSVCSGVALSYALQSGIGAVYYAVSSDETNVPASSNTRGTLSTANITDTYTNTTGSDVTITYYITPGEMVSMPTCYSSTYTYTVTVHPTVPVVSNQFPSEICSGIQLNYSLDDLIDGTADTYTYTVSTNNASVPAGDDRTTASNANITDTYTNTTGNLVTITYTITPYNNGCPGSSFFIEFKFYSVLDIPDQTSTTLCSDVGLNYSLDALIDGSDDTYTYTVSSTDQANVPAGPDRTMASSANITDTYTNTTSSDVTITYTVTPFGSNGCAGATFIVPFVIEPEPVVSNQPSSNICSDIALNYSLDALIDGTADEYTYTVSSDNSNVDPEPARTMASDENITHTYTNTTSSDATITYTVTPIGANGCSGNTFTVTFVIEPEPVVSNQSSSDICSDVALNYSLDDLIAGSGDTYTYTVSSTDQANVPAGPARTTASSANITDTYTNTTSSDVTITYTVTPIGSNGCSGNTFTVTFVIEPEPVVSNQTPPAVCSGTAINYSLDDLITGSGDTYTYTVSSSDEGNVPAGDARTSASAANITDTYTNTTGNAVTITYTVTPIGSNGCEGNMFTIAFDIVSAPVVTDQTPPSVCSDIPVNFSLDDLIDGTNDVYTYTVTSSNGFDVPAGDDRNTASNADITDAYTNETGSDVTITYTVTPYLGTCEGSTFTVTFTIKHEPVVLDQYPPEVCSDVSLNYSLDDLITGSGDTYTYTVSSSDEGNVPAGDARTTASNANITDTYTNTTGSDVTITYSVIPYGANNCSGDIFYIEFVVEPEPVVTNQDVISVCSGENLNYAIKDLIPGPGDTYSYTVSSSDETNVPPGPDRTNPSAAKINDSYTNNTSNTVTITYTVTPYGSNGCAGDIFTIPFEVAPLASVSQPATVTVCSGTQLNYSLDNLIDGNNDVYTYTVSSSNESSVPTPPALDRTTASANNITDTYTNYSDADVTVTYTVTPIIGDCSGSVFSLNFVIQPEPSLNSINGGSICSGVEIDYSLDALIDGSDDEYSYTVTSNNAAVDPEAARTIASDANIVYTYQNTSGTDAIIVYKVTPIGANGCLGDEFDIQFTILPEPVVTNQDGGSVCSDVALNYSLDDLLPGNNDEYTYTVTSDNPGVDPEAARTTASDANITHTYTNTTTSNATITYTVTPIGANGCSGATFTVVFTIVPEPVLSNQSDVTTCSDIALNYSLDDLITGSGDTYTYTVSSTDESNVPAGPDRGTASAANITDTYTNTTGSDVTITYTVTPIQGICSGNTFTIKFIINPEPSLQNQSDETTCSDIALNYSLDDLITGSGDIYSYTVSSTDETNVPAGPDRSTASAANITDTYTNTTGVDVTITYTITPIGSNGCAGNTFTLNFIIEPEPVISDQTPPAVCSGISLNFNLDSLIVGNDDVYSYTVATSNPAVPAGPNRGTASDLPITDNYSNNTGTTVTITYTVTPFGENGCEGDPFDIVFDINSEPNISDQSGGIICSGTAINYSLDDLIAGGMDTYSYTVSSTDETNVPAGPDRGTASNAPITDTYTNTTGSDVTITYTVTPFLGTCEGSSFDVTFTIERAPSIDVNSITDECADDIMSYTLTANALNTSSVTLVSGSGTVSYADPLVTITDIPNNTAVTIEMTSSNGCTAQFTFSAVNCTCTGDFIPNPPVSGGDQAVCFGSNNIPLTVTVEAGESANWYDTESQGSPLNDTPTTTYLSTEDQPGVYEYWVETVDLTSGCVSDTRTKVTFTIYNLPNITTEGTEVICAGLNADLNATFTPEGSSTSIANWLWELTSGTGTITNPSIEDTEASGVSDGSVFTVTATDNHGCINSADLIVQVIQKPTATFTFVSGDGTYCSGTDKPDLKVTFTGTQPFEFVYSIDGVNQPAITGITEFEYIISDVDPGDYKLESYADAGCAGDPINTTLTVVEKQSPSPEISAPKLKICEGETMILTADSSGYTSYNWAGPNGPINPPAQPNEIQINSSGMYFLTVTNSAICTGVAQIQIDSSTLNAAINYLALPDTNGICEGDSVSLSAVGVGSDVVTSYEWSTNKMTQNITEGPVVNTTYIVTVTNEYECTSTETIEVVVHEPENPDIEVDNFNNCDGDSVFLTMNNIANFKDIDWGLSGGEETSNGFVFITNASVDSFDVITVDQNDCNGEATVGEFITYSNPKVSINESDFDAKQNQEVTITTDLNIDSRCENTPKYTWYINKTNDDFSMATIINGQTEAQLSYTINGNPGEIWHIFVEVEDGCGCVAQDYDRIEIQIVDNDICSAQTIKSADQACVGQSVVFELKTQGGTGNIFTSTGWEIQRDNGATFKIDAEGDFDDYKVLNLVVGNGANQLEEGYLEIEFDKPGTYTLTFEYNYNPCIRTKTFEIQVYNSPEIDGIQLADDYCNGDEVIIPIDGLPNGSFKWDMYYNINGGVDNLFKMNSTEKQLNLGNLTESIVLNLSSLYDQETGCIYTFGSQSYNIDVLDVVSETNSFECDDSQENIQYTFKLDGGRPPYALNYFNKNNIQIFLESNPDSTIVTSLEPNTVFDFRITSACDEEKPLLVKGDNDCLTCPTISTVFENSNIEAYKDLVVCGNASTVINLKDLNLDVDQYSFVVVLKKNQDEGYFEGTILDTIGVFDANDFSFDLIGEDLLDKITYGSAYSLFIYGLPKDANGFIAADCEGRRIPMTLIQEPEPEIISKEDVLCKNQTPVVLLADAKNGSWIYDNTFNGGFKEVGDYLVLDFKNTDFGDSYKFQLQDSVAGCYGFAEITLSVSDDENDVAPPIGDIYYWPGDLFTYSDTAALCYNWGINGDYIEEDEGGTNRYFIYEEAFPNQKFNINFDTLWVEVSYLNDGECNDCINRVYLNQLNIPKLVFNPNANYNLEIYPNPTHTSFDISLYGQQGGQFVYTIYDIRGKYLTSKAFEKADLKHVEHVDIDQYGAGIYFVKIIDESGNAKVHKLIKL